MFAATPRLEIHIDRLAGNARSIIAECSQHGVQVAAVTKVVQAHPALLRALEEAGVGMIADSIAGGDFGLFDPGACSAPGVRSRKPTR